MHAFSLGVLILISSFFHHDTAKAVKAATITASPTVIMTVTPIPTMAPTPTVFINPYQIQLKSNLHIRLRTIDDELTQKQDQLQKFTQLSKQQEDEMQQDIDNDLKNDGEGGVYYSAAELTTPLIALHNSNQQKIQNMNMEIETLQEEKIQILIELSKM